MEKKAGRHIMHAFLTAAKAAAGKLKGIKTIRR